MYTHIHKDLMSKVSTIKKKETKNQFYRKAIMEPHHAFPSTSLFCSYVAGDFPSTVTVLMVLADSDSSELATSPLLGFSSNLENLTSLILVPSTRLLQGFLVHPSIYQASTHVIWAGLNKEKHVGLRLWCLSTIS